MFQRYCLPLSCLATLLATAPAGAQTYDVRASTVNYHIFLGSGSI